MNQSQLLTVAAMIAVPLAVAVVGLLGTVIGVLLGTWAGERERRRSGFAEAVAVLVAWHEYPYRIRRRVSDVPEELHRLAELGHDLQEHLARYQTWVDAESAFVGSIYRQVRMRLKAAIAPHLQEAWASPPLVNPVDMNLDDWGPEPAEAELQALRTAIDNRFGWRRILGLNMLPWCRPRLPVATTSIEKSEQDS